MDRCRDRPGPGLPVAPQFSTSALRHCVQYPDRKEVVELCRCRSAAAVSEASGLSCARPSGRTGTAGTRGADDHPCHPPDRRGGTRLHAGRNSDPTNPADFSGSSPGHPLLPRRATGPAGPGGPAAQGLDSRTVHRHAGVQPNVVIRGLEELPVTDPRVLTSDPRVDRTGGGRSHLPTAKGPIG